MPLNDILNCAESELWSILDSDDGYENDGWFMAKGIGMIELCKLGEMLGVASYDELKSGFNLVGDPRDEGPWPQTIPTSLMERIGALSDADISSVVKPWAEIEEFDGAATTDSLTDYLNRIRQFVAWRSGEFFVVNAL